MVLVTSFEESFLGSLKAEDLTRSVKNGDAAMKLEHGSGFTENDVGNDKKISFGAETVTVTSASTLVEYDDVTSDDETNEVDNNEEKEGDPVLKAYMEIFKQRCGNDDSCPTQTNAVSFFGDVVQKNAE